MAENSLRGPAVLAPIGRGWQRLAPGLVPVLAVITAFLIGIPFMIFTSLVSGGTVGDGLRTSGAAYAALIEGSVGLTVNDLVSADNVNTTLLLTETQPFAARDLTALSRSTAEVAAAGSDQVRAYGAVLESISLSDEEFDQLGVALADIERVGTDTLDSLRPLVAELDLLERREVRELAATFRGVDTLSAEARAAVEAVAPAAADYNDADLLAAMQLVEREGFVPLERMVSQLDTLAASGIEPGGADSGLIAQIAATGTARVRELVSTQALLDSAGVQDAALASEQALMVRRMFDAGVLAGDDVHIALRDTFDSAVSDNLVVRRPGNRLVVDKNSALAGIIYTDANTPEDPTDDRPDVVYLRLGGSALLFIPANLEATIVRAIPYIIAGLAVALGFKAGLFNIGAEGQLYAGATFAVWVGYTFTDLPLIVHLPLVIIAGLIGGALWGSIPGTLKAFTGAHEVITTIMLNFVAILLVDWLIKSTNPVLMQDAAASIPRTPFIAASARLPLFSQIAPLWYVVAGVIFAGVLLYFNRRAVTENPRRAVRPLVYGALVTVGGLFLAWVSVRNSLHLGLVIMIAAVWLTDWFLTRTTLGFELRTVGANPNAARYAGMSVPRNIVMAMALAGMLAGLAGTVQVSGVQFNMQPLFFAGLGFDAIAVALLARSNPRNMIPAGLLWGGLLTGAGLMQINANISVDLVKIIQALIIMFIAADAIIRALWRVPEQGKGDVTGSTFSKGWGA